ncbi:MAG: hypothetical protein IJ917_11835 [Firmicutes bacterium]|nr:hypothetical protein [Bacillota bacterium]
MKRSRCFILILLLVCMVTACGKASQIGNVFAPPSSSETEEEQQDSGHDGERKEQGGDLAPTPVPHEEAWEEEDFDFEEEGPPQPVEVEIPYLSNKYFINRLSQEELEDFKALYLAAQQFEERCYYPFPITPEQNDMLAQMLVYECPEMMHYNREATYTYYTNGDGQVTSRTIEYAMDATALQNKMTQAEAVLEQMEAEMAGLSDYEKELYIYRYIISHNTYDRTTTNAENPYGMLVENRAKCDGIALTFKWLMDRAGIPNYILTGRLLDDSDGHAWNVVQIDGTWYDLDITHDDIDAPEFPELYIYGLVNVDRNMIRGQYDLQQSYQYFDLPGADTMEGCYHFRNWTFVLPDESLQALFDDLLYRVWTSGAEGSFAFQIQDTSMYRDFLDDTQSYIDYAASYYGFSFDLVWYYMDESQAVWFYVTFR